MRHFKSERSIKIQKNSCFESSLGSGYDSYGTSGYDYSPPASPRYNHIQAEERRSSRHSPDR